MLKSCECNKSYLVLQSLCYINPVKLQSNFKNERIYEKKISSTFSRFIPFHRSSSGAVFGKRYRHFVGRRGPCCRSFCDGRWYKDGNSYRC